MISDIPFGLICQLINIELSESVPALADECHFSIKAGCLQGICFIIDRQDIPFLIGQDIMEILVVSLIVPFAAYVLNKLDRMCLRIVSVSCKR